MALGTPLSMEPRVPAALRKNFCSHQTSDTKPPSCWCHQKVIHSFSQYLLGPHCVAGRGPATGHTAVRGRESRFLQAPVSHLCLQEALPQAASRFTELSVHSCLAFFLRCSGSRGSRGSLWDPLPGCPEVVSHGSWPPKAFPDPKIAPWPSPHSLHRTAH